MQTQKIIKYIERKQRLFLFLSLLNLSVAIILLGAMMNNFVANSNNGKMPVYIDYIDSEYSDQHFSFTDKSIVKYSYLSDIFKKKVGDFGNIYYSFGDLLMFVGFISALLFFILIFTLTIRLRKEDKEIRVIFESMKGGKNE